MSFLIGQGAQPEQRPREEDGEETRDPTTSTTIGQPEGEQPNNIDQEEGPGQEQDGPGPNAH